MKILFRIQRPDDSGDYHETKFLYRSTRSLGKPNLNHNGECVFVAHLLSDSSSDLDPVYKGIESQIKSGLLPTSKRWKHYDQITSLMTFKFKDGSSTIVFQKSKPHFYLNGIKTNKAIIMSNLAKIIYKSCFVDTAARMDEYVNRVLTFPPNVLHSVENRTPYNFYTDNMTKQEVRLNTKIISDNECALEISDGVWANITVKDLNSFINFHRFKQKRSEKWGISPERLWRKLLGEEPSPTQTKVMHAFLTQNRTQDIVERRAKELVRELEETYPNKIKTFKTSGGVALPDRLGMIVRGVVCDWVLLEKRQGKKTNTQGVQTYMFNQNHIDNDAIKNMEATTSGVFLDGVHCGNFTPNCIDNIHKNSSLGDQFASRAMMLMNDLTARTMVSTLHLPEYVPEFTSRLPQYYFDNPQVFADEWGFTVE